MKKLVLAVLSVILFGAVYFGLSAQSDKLSDEQKNKIADIVRDIDLSPDFKLTDLNDSTHTLKELKGKVVLLNFWATWCYPCRMEIPEFNDIYDKYSNDGLEILGISISDNKKMLINFTKSYKIDYPVLYGSSQEINNLTLQYGGVNAVPTSFLIGKKGNILKTYPGAIMKGYPIYNQFLIDLQAALTEK